MKEFNELCKEFEEMDVLSYGACLAAKSIQIVPALATIMEDGMSGVSVFATFILGAIAADGRLSEEEYALCYPLLHAFFGEKLDYEVCKRAVRYLRPESRELKKAAKEMIRVFGEVSEELKDDIILVCMMICAIDGKISLKEKNWIKKLIA